MTKEKLQEEFIINFENSPLAKISNSEFKRIFDWFYSKLQEQDRESRNKVLRELWKMGTVYETMDTRSATIAYAKQHNIDLHEN